jgi:hypothetical protein
MSCLVRLWSSAFDDALWVADPLGDLAQFADEREALGNRVWGADGSQTAVKRVAAITRGLVAKHACQAGKEPGPQIDVLLGEGGEALLQQRHELIVASGPRPHEATALTGRRAGELAGQAETAGNAGGVEEGPLRGRTAGQ